MPGVSGLRDHFSGLRLYEALTVDSRQLVWLDRHGCVPVS